MKFDSKTMLLAENILAILGAIAFLGLGFIYTFALLFAALPSILMLLICSHSIIVFDTLLLLVSIFAILTGALVSFPIALQMKKMTSFQIDNLFKMVIGLDLAFLFIVSYTAVLTTGNWSHAVMPPKILLGCILGIGIGTWLMFQARRAFNASDILAPLRQHKKGA